MNQVATGIPGGCLEDAGHKNPKVRFSFPDYAALAKRLAGSISCSPAERGEKACVELLSKLKTEGAIP